MSLSVSGRVKPPKGEEAVGHRARVGPSWTLGGERMQNFGSGASALFPLQGARRVWASLGLLAVTLVMTVPVYGGWFAGSREDVYRFGMPLLWGGLALATLRRPRLAPFRVLLKPVWRVPGLCARPPGGQWTAGLARPLAATPQGAAVAKISSEVLPVCASLFLAAFLAGSSLASLGLHSGQGLAQPGAGASGNRPAAGTVRRRSVRQQPGGAGPARGDTGRLAAVDRGLPSRTGS